MNPTNYYVIAGGNRQIWVVNPLTKQKLRIKLAKDDSRVLDIYAGASLYHASELITTEEKNVDGHLQLFDVNYVQIIDTISGRSCVTITPPGTVGQPLENRLVTLDFRFAESENALYYQLNGFSGTVFQQCNAGLVQSGMTNFSGREVYHGERRIASFDEEILCAKEIDAHKFARAFRLKDRTRFYKNKAFFG